MVGFFTGIKKLTKLPWHIVSAGIVLLHSLPSLPHLLASGGSEQTLGISLTWGKENSCLGLVAVQGLCCHAPPGLNYDEKKAKMQRAEKIPSAAGCQNEDGSNCEFVLGQVGQKDCSGAFGAKIEPALPKACMSDKEAILLPCRLVPGCYRRSNLRRTLENQGKCRTMQRERAGLL